MNHENPKNYYSLNLTEGRIFIIFITILIIVCVVAFGIALLISNTRKATDVNVNMANEENLNLNSQNLSYYEELDKDNKVDSFAGNQTNNNNNSQNTNEYKLEVKETDIEKNENTKTAVKIENKEAVNLDDSEVVYSSKYIDDSSNNEKVSAEKTKPVVKKSNTTQTIKQKEVKKTVEKRYIVQIGSYINKKTAEEISLFYQIQGYPAYIIETINKEKTYYRLRVGPFKEKNKAEEYLTSLKNSKYGDSSYISVVYL